MTRTAVLLSHSIVGYSCDFEAGLNRPRFIEAAGKRRAGLKRVHNHVKLSVGHDTLRHYGIRRRPTKTNRIIHHLRMPTAADIFEIAVGMDEGAKLAAG